MLVHKFSVRAEDGAPKHEVMVSIPHFAETTPTQRENAWRKAIASLTIDVQRNLRKRVAKGLRGEALNAEAQKLFRDAIDAKRAIGTSLTVVDAAELKLNSAQVAGLRKSGALVINEDWELEDEDLDDENDDENE